MPEKNDHGLDPAPSLRRRVLRALAVQIYRHPYLALLGLIAVTAFAGRQATRLDVARNLRVSVPMAPKERQAWNATRMVAPRNELVFAVIRLDSPRTAATPDIGRVAALFAEAWTDPDYIASAARVETTAASANTRARLIDDRQLLWALRPTELNRLRQLTTTAGASNVLAEMSARTDATGERSNSLPETDPLGIFQHTQQSVDAAMRGVWNPVVLNTANSPQPGYARAVVRLRPTQEADELVYCARLHRFLVETVEVLKRRYPRDLGLVSVAFHGSHIETARLASGLKNDLVRSVVILVLCLFLLLVLAFRKIEAVLFVGLPPCIGLVWTFGLVSSFYESLNLLSAALAVLLMALGAEYAVQIYHRFVEELYREKQYYVALGTAYAEAGRGVLVCTLATALIFFSVYLSTFQNLRELALVAVLGIFCMTASVLLWLPLMAALKSRLARGRVQPVEMYDFGLKDLSAAVIASPRAAVALGLIVTAYLAYFSRDTRINREIGLDLGAAARERASQSSVREPAGAPDKPLFIQVDAASLQEALALNDRVYSNLTDPPHAVRADEIDSLSPLLPSLALQTEVRQGLAQLDLLAIRRSLDAAGKPRGIAPAGFSLFVKRLAALQALTHTAPLADLSSWADASLVAQAQDHIVHDEGRYRILTTVHPITKRTNLIAGDLGRISSKAGVGMPAAAIRFDSEVLENRRVARAVIFSMALAVFLAAISLLICLLPHFHGRLVDTFLAMLPLVCATVWVLGLLAFFRFHIGLYTLLISPLLTGIALDQSVSLIQRLRERRYASLRQVLRLGGRPNIVAALALVIGVGCLGQVDFRPLQEMALVTVVAVVFSTVTTLILVPALLQIRQEGGLAAWGSDPVD